MSDRMPPNRVRGILIRQHVADGCRFGSEVARRMAELDLVKRHREGAQRLTKLSQLYCAILLYAATLRVERALRARIEAPGGQRCRP